MTTALIYLVVLAVVGGVLFLVAALVFGRGEELAPLPPGATPTVLPEDGVTGDDVRELRFQQVLRGYKASEVDWALDRLATEIDELRAQLSAAPTTESRGRPTLMPTLQLRREIAAPAQVVWDAVVDWPAQGAWMLATTVRVVGGDGRSVGSELAAYSGVRPVGFLDTMVITEWDPPRRCVVGHTGRFVRGDGIFEVHPRGEQSCVFLWREDLDLPGGVLGRLGWPLAKLPFAWGVRYSLRKLARYCELRAR